MKKDVKQVIQYATNHGFHFEGYTGSGHVRIRHKGGRAVIMPMTPNGGNRWRKNALALIHKISKDDS